MPSIRRIAIVGAEGKKFTEDGAITAQQIIDSIICDAVQCYNVVKIVSGHCHLGGVDIWAEETANAYRVAGSEVVPQIYPPGSLRWEPHGYKERNIQIAEGCDELHCIVVAKLPPGYEAQPFEGPCYHCQRRVKHQPYHPHIKSGGCWTMWHAFEWGKDIHLHIIDNA